MKMINKIKALIDLIRKEKTINECSRINNKPSFVFHSQDEDTLAILGTIYSAAVIPFIDYSEDALKENKDFEKFRDYSTTNENIFLEFARDMAKNKIFVPKKRRVSKVKKEYNTKEFSRLLRD